MPLDLIIFIAIAVVAVLKLRSILGKKIGLEQKPTDSFKISIGLNKKKANEDDGVIDVKANQNNAYDDDYDLVKTGDVNLDRALTAIAEKDKYFNVEDFIAGASKAYEMIFDGFLSGNRKLLKALLSEEVNEGFVAAIEAREKAGEECKDEIKEMKSATIIAAQLDGSIASIDVEFTTSQINATYDKVGQLIDGSPDIPVILEEIWEFSRDLSSDDPKWILTGTMLKED